jgi:transposase
MNCATKTRRTQILVWLIWAMACLVLLLLPERTVWKSQDLRDLPALPGALLLEQDRRILFPWLPRHRFRKWAWRHYCRLRRAYQRALWATRLARLAARGAFSIARLVDLLTETQVRRHLGALPVLYALLETLQVRTIINRHCATRAEVDHGTVALVLVLNRLTMPLPLYQIADWMARTVLVYRLGIPAPKFNDDRLARTLDAIAPHCQAIWQEVVERAIVQAEIDLSVVFYDLTAFVTHGAYADSKHVDFGHANNTPMKKRKFKAGLDVTADGNFPADYALWSGRTTDMATVEENMKRLRRLLQRQGWSSEQVLILGDRGTLSDKLALAYDQQRLHYLAGLRLLKKVHKALVTEIPECKFAAYPLTQERGAKGYWGIPCRVPFEHEGRKANHRGLVVLSGPMRAALRKTRAKRLLELRQDLCTEKCVQQRANSKLKASPVGKLVRAEAYTDEQGLVCLHWWIDRYSLWQASQRDGRYLLVTNDWSLSTRQMLDLYHQKDGVEKRIRVCKNDLRVSPVYLHKDERIKAMLLINMLALVAYSVLERQTRQAGIHLTGRRIIAKLQSLDVIVTRCCDGSQLPKLVPLDEEQEMLLQTLSQVLAQLWLPRWPWPRLSQTQALPLALAPPGKTQMLA